MKLPGMIRFLFNVFKNTYNTLTGHQRVQEGFPDSWDPAQDAKKVETIVWSIRSDKDVNFVADIAQNNSGNVNLTGLSSNKIRIKRVSCFLVATAPRSFDIWVAKTDTFQGPTPANDIDLDTTRVVTEFLATDARRANPAGYAQYIYDSKALDNPYEDMDGTFELHIMLVWRDAVGYDPTAPGVDRFVAEVEYEPDS